MSPGIVTVHVALLNEGTDCWRPVKAESLGGDCYRLIGPIPEDEVWQFQPDETVRCAMHNFSDGDGLLAIESISN